MSSRHLGQYKANFYIMEDEDLIVNLPPTKAMVTQMRFQVVPLSYCCNFKSILFALHAYSNVCVFIIIFIISV